MKAKGLEIDKTYRFIFYILSFSIFLTGFIAIILHYFFITETDFEIIPSPYVVHFINLHGLIAPFFLIIFGSLFPLHIQRAIKAKINFASGIMLLITLITLIVSGYYLYYCSDDYLRYFVKNYHMWLGLMIPVFLFFHIKLGKRY